ncbi:MAG TPA: DoxX family protein [Polyangia bacterium]|jgi:hypothetical protein
MENVLASPNHHPVALPFTVRGPRTLLWTGRVLTGLIAAVLLVDAIAKLLQLAPVVEGTQKLGFAISVIRPLGVVLALSTLLHLIPRLQLLGAVLVTAYLGGATATLVHAGTPFWFPVAMGTLLWIAYYLRSPRLRSFLASTSL